MLIDLIAGARPNFIKIASIIRAFQSRKANSSRNLNYRLVHTGQHYDQNMSEMFFKQMGIPKPDYDLGVSSGHHGQQTAKILSELENIYIKEKPDYVLVFGDTNSTLAY